MMAANNSLKTNRSLLSKKDKRKGFFGSYQGGVMAKFPKTNEKELAALREKLKRERKQIRVRQIAVFVGVIVLLITASLLLF